MTAWFVFAAMVLGAAVFLAVLFRANRSLGAAEVDWPAVEAEVDAVLAGVDTALAEATADLVLAGSDLDAELADLIDGEGRS